jgi:prophage antirepressor-like protein
MFDELRSHNELPEEQQVEIATSSNLLKRQASISSDDDEKMVIDIKRPKIDKSLQTITDTNQIKETRMNFGSQMCVFVYLEESEQLWFLSKTICDSLGYENSTKAINDNVSKNNVRRFNESLTLTASYTSISHYNIRIDSKFINEAGLYQLIMKSKMPKAKEFQDWVTSEVLPSLRKTGHYSMEQASMKDAENLNLINRIVEGSNAQWYEEKIKLLEELREKDQQHHKAIQEKDQQHYKTIQEKDHKIHEKDQQIILKTQETVVALQEKNQLQTKLHEIKPLVATRPERVEVFHKLELFKIKPNHGFQFGYFCSRVQERNAPRARPDEDEEAELIFSIKCANSINAYNCVKEKLRSTLDAQSYNIIGKRFYCNIPAEFIDSYFHNILRV